MESKPSDDEHSLLARLNELKPSTVQLEHRKIPYGEGEGEDEASEPPVLDLHARFLALGTSAGAPAAASHHEVEPGEDVDDLLAELRDKISLAPNDDDENVKLLVKDAKGFLASSTQLTSGSKADFESPNTRGPDEDNEEQEAEEYIQQVMDEMRSERAGEQDDDGSTPDAQNRSNPDPATTEEPRLPHKNDNPQSPPEQPTPFNLPDTPTTPLRSPLDEKDESDPTSLPSAPTFLPADRAIHITNNRTGSRWSGNDHGPPSWCCICNDDAKIKCLDCDGDLIYCVRCWKEMHLEEGGEEERRHRGVEFTRRAAGAMA